MIANRLNRSLVAFIVLAALFPALVQADEAGITVSGFPQSLDYRGEPVDEYRLICGLEDDDLTEIGTGGPGPEVSGTLEVPGGVEGLIYCAVVAVDFEGNASDLSSVIATPFDTRLRVPPTTVPLQPIHIQIQLTCPESSVCSIGASLQD